MSNLILTPKSQLKNPSNRDKVQLDSLLNLARKEWQTAFLKYERIDAKVIEALMANELILDSAKNSQG